MIRRLQIYDIPQVKDVYLHAHLAEYAGESVTFEPQGLNDDPTLWKLFCQSEVFVFDDKKVIKGFVGQREHRIIWLYVDPSYQGQKVGQQLIDYMLNHLNDIAAISVVKSNQLARDVYLRRGFKIENEFEFNYQGTPVIALSMYKVPSFQSGCSG